MGHDTPTLRSIDRTIPVALKGHNAIHVYFIRCQKARMIIADV